MHRKKRHVFLEPSIFKSFRYKESITEPVRGKTRGNMPKPQPTVELTAQCKQCLQRFTVEGKQAYAEGEIRRRMRDHSKHGHTNIRFS